MDYCDFIKVLINYVADNRSGVPDSVGKAEPNVDDEDSSISVRMILQNNCMLIVRTLFILSKVLLKCYYINDYRNFSQVII